MSSSVTLSIVTNSLIAASKGFGWSVTGSPTLFAETIHSLADVGNQVLLKVGEVRGKAGPDREHPFGRGQEKFFWALVSAVSVFFIGCGINIYHGVACAAAPDGVAAVHAAGHRSAAVRAGARVVDLHRRVPRNRRPGKGLRENRSNVTVLAVLLEDGVALLGILLTLLVAGIALGLGPAAGIRRGRRDRRRRAARRHGAVPRGAQPPAADRQLRPGTRPRGRGVAARAQDCGQRPLAGARRRPGDRVRPLERPGRRSFALGQEIKAHAGTALGKRIDAVYWKFMSGALPVPPAG